MEMLGQLEDRIDALLARFEAARGENARLEAEIASLRAGMAALAEENHNLHARLEQGENLRAEALRRIDGLLLRLREHDSVG